MCNLGNNCSFAHGEQQLRSTNQFYKTTICIGFTKGNCNLGDNCRFAHGEQELKNPQYEENNMDNYNLNNFLMNLESSLNNGYYNNSTNGT